MRPLLALGALALAALMPACSCNNTPGETVPCDTGTDVDGDHYGAGCAAGPDCDDNNPDVHDSCCAIGEYEGCPCDPAVDTVVPCFDGPAEVSNNPPCTKGERTCSAAGTWSACVGEVVPAEEHCDGIDNDCDLETDEGVLTACGNCIPGCDTVEVGPNPFPFPPDDPGVGVDGVGLDPNGDLILDSSTIEDHYLWIANDQEGTVSKLDTRSGAEVGRYASVTHDPARVVDHTGGRPFPSWNTDANGNGYADNRPSRTAIDFKGDMWVTNRAHDFGGLQPSATKIYNNPVDCVDRNGNGVFETSHEVNGIPGIQITDPAEFFGEADECIAMTVVVGALGGTARACAIDAGSGGDSPGNVWVGMWGEQAFYQLDGQTGALLQRVATPGVSPYGAAIDSQGRLWAPDYCCGSTSAVLGMIDTGQNPASFATTSPHPAYTSGGIGSYGIVVDLEDRVWVGGYPYGGLFRYDPATTVWTEVQIPGYFSGWGSRGVGIDSRGNVWAAVHPGAGGIMARIDADTATVTGTWQIDGPQGAGSIPVGIGVDFDGDVWTVNQASSNASRLHIDPITGEPAPHPTTGNIVDTFPVGPQPYTYSDFTGLGLRTVTRPSGEYRVPIQGCASGEAAHWLSVTWNATTPPETAVEIYVRAGNDLGTLDTQPEYGPWTVSPGDLQQVPPGAVPDAKYILLTIRLLSLDRTSTPIVHGYSVQWTCPGPG